MADISSSAQSRTSAVFRQVARWDMCSTGLLMRPH